MSKILLLVHCEDAFRSMFPSMFIPRLIKECRNADWVIHFTSHVNDDEPIEDIIPYVNEQIDWGWGYEKEQFLFDDNEDEAKWVIDSIGHEFTWVPPELRNGRFKSNDFIVLGGGAEWECLADMVSVLDYQDIEYKKLSQIVF